MIVEAIRTVTAGKDLSTDEASQVMETIMTGQATDAQVAALITALRMKGETVDEITGFARVMRKHATPISCGTARLVDTCGTGGDGLHTFNISTTAAFVVAGAGAAVAKHGNRSVSSKSGSADVLESLGIKIDLPPDRVAECVDKAGVGFLFAPLFHMAMKHAIGPRREIGIRTVFNVLGPLTNPARVRAQVVGVYDGELTETMAHVLHNLGVEHALVVHGADCMDEISNTGASKICEVKDGAIRTYSVQPSDFGLPPAELDELKGGEAAENAGALVSILRGERGPKRDVVLMNAAAALVAADLAADLAEGIEMAAESIDGGSAFDRLQCLRELAAEA